MGFNFSTLFNFGDLFLIEHFYVPRGKISTDDGKGTVILGQDADSLGGGFDENQALSGAISEFHMWDRSLTKEEIMQLLDCNLAEQTLGGNLINWNSETNWKTHNVTIQDIDNICNKDNVPEFVIFNQRMPFNDIRFHCQVMGGTLPHQLDEKGGLAYYETVLEVFKKETNTGKSPCVSKYDGVEKVKYWIGYKLSGKYLFHTCS